MKDLKDERRAAPSASGFPNYDKCPKSYQAQIGKEDLSDGAAREIGNRTHQGAFDQESITLTDKEMEVVSELLDARNAILKRVWNDWEDNPPEFINEVRIWYRNNRYSGVPDVLAIRGGVAVVLDYKTGPIQVTHASENLQLMALAVLVAWKYKVDRVLVGIIQPLAGPPHTHNYDKDGLKKARNKITRILRKIEDPNAKPVAGPKQCKYCRAINDCSAVKAAEDKVMALSTVTALSPDEMSKALGILPVVEGRCKALKDEAYSRLLKDNDSIPGFGVRPPSNRRSISDPWKAYKTLTDGGYVDSEGFLNCCTVSLSKLATAASKFTGENKIEVQFEIEDALGKVIKASEVKGKVVEK